MIFTQPANDTLPGIFAWAKRHIDDLNRFHMPINRWPVFANDAAASAGNLKVGQGYVTPDGFAKRRMA